MALQATSLSPALMAANQRLHQLREQLQGNKGNNQQKNHGSLAEDVLPWEKDKETAVSITANLPPHLGWESGPASLVIRAALGLHNPESDSAADNQLRAGHPSFRSISDGSHPGGQPLGASDGGKVGTQLRLSLEGDTVKHYPSIGIAALKAEQAAIYRVWLMSRYLDVDGRGWLPVQDVRGHLTGKESKLRLFCWRRLRQVLGQGHGRFWHRDKAQGRIWLFGAARVAAHLDVEKLTGKPVALPVKTITAGIGDFKAHLYGAWHSGRKTNSPISREVQEAITSIPERTQRHYCKVAGIRHQTNIAIGNKKNPEEVEKQAWQRGRATFEFVDHQGRQGRKGATYIAWHLPNSYSSPHQQIAKGRMRKINRKLSVLVTKGARGNGGETIEKLYFANGKEAVRRMEQDLGKDKYWSMTVPKSKNHFWACFFVA